VQGFRVLSIASFLATALGDGAEPDAKLLQEYGDGDIQSYKGNEVEEFPCMYYDSNGLYDFKDLRFMEDDYQVRQDSTEITFNFCKLIEGCGSRNTFAAA
jgi:hypothetical protein